ncbi:pollen-specific leucine-rich repeat extensin-like protein 4 [Iris pallida]|uniref:Pollen-specific leucine-rich repeat extensin-like protein 4 n=1 Tax=Iris pallida TaxID=29817 RepID=A0AAX6FKK6_IRIPA|nr:pollen-specific leucine-rich repeat extensin-like protein 4 [Iris pallida]
MVLVAPGSNDTVTTLAHGNWRRLGTAPGSHCGRRHSWGRPVRRGCGGPRRPRSCMRDQLRRGLGWWKVTAARASPRVRRRSGVAVGLVGAHTE